MHTDQAWPRFHAFSAMTLRQRLYRRRRPAVRSSSSSTSRTVLGSAILADGCGSDMAENGITVRRIMTRLQSDLPEWGFWRATPCAPARHSRAPAAIVTPMTRSMASHLGRPFRSSQNRDGVLMIAMNTDNRNSSTIDSAARISATTTTNAAVVSSTDPALDLPEEQRCRKVPARPRDSSGGELPCGGLSASRPRRLGGDREHRSRRRARRFRRRPSPHPDHRTGATGK